MEKKVIIVGAGIGGLAAALSLLKRGLDVEVHEQAPELKEVGAGIQISSNGTRVLYALGLEDALKRVQVLPSSKVASAWSSAESAATHRLFSVIASGFKARTAPASSPCRSPRCSITWGVP